MGAVTGAPKTAGVLGRRSGLQHRARLGCRPPPLLATHTHTAAHTAGTGGGGAGAGLGLELRKAMGG